MLFLVKGESSPAVQEFGHQLVEALDLPHPEWPLGDESERQKWESVLEGLPVGDFVENFDVPFVDVDRVAGLVFFRSRERFPLPADWRETVARVGFWSWMGDRMKEMLTPEFLPEVFALTTQMIDAQEHAVVLGGTLGLSPANSTLARMILFKYPRAPTLSIFIKRAARPSGEAGRDGIVARAVIHGEEWPLSEVLSRLRPTPDGQFAFDASSRE